MIQGGAASIWRGLVDDGGAGMGAARVVDRAILSLVCPRWRGERGNRESDGGLRGRDGVPVYVR